VRLSREETICGAFECPSKSSSGRGQAVPVSLIAKDKFGFTALMYVKEEGHKRARKCEIGAHIHKLRLFVISVVVFVLTMPLQALATEEEHEAHKESHYDRHHVAILLGNTHEEDEDNFTIGLDYEYRFSQSLGIGLLIEYVCEDSREVVGMFPCHYTLIKGSAS